MKTCRSDDPLMNEADGFQYICAEFIKVTTVDGVLPKHNSVVYTYTGRLRVKEQEGLFLTEKLVPVATPGTLSSFMFPSANTGGY